MCGLEALVAEWNDAYHKLSKEVDLCDLTPEAYEAEVGVALLEICGGNVDLALAVFKHEENDGGWMNGNVPFFLERKRRPG